MKMGKPKVYACGERECPLPDFDGEASIPGCDICGRNCKHDKMAQGDRTVKVEYCEHCGKVVRVLDPYSSV